MKAGSRLTGLMMILAVLGCSGSALAWDTRWRFRQTAPYSSGPTEIVMQKKLDPDPMKAFKGTIDGGSGYTVLRNLNGESLRGIIDRDGSGVLRDENGRLHRIHTRW